MKTKQCSKNSFFGWRIVLNLQFDLCSVQLDVEQMSQLFHYYFSSLLSLESFHILRSFQCWRSFPVHTRVTQIKMMSFFFPGTHFWPPPIFDPSIRMLAYIQKHCLFCFLNQSQVKLNQWRNNKEMLKKLVPFLTCHSLKQMHSALCGHGYTASKYSCYSSLECFSPEKVHPQFAF